MRRNLTGQKIANYEIIAHLGEGGMGNVYLAQDTALQRKAAIKFLFDEDSDAQTKKRFVNEAKAAQRLNHPNIISVYDSGEWENNAWMAMEYIDGQTLDESFSGGLPAPETGESADSNKSVEKKVELALQLAGALQHAHSAGIVHRDVKPQNIMLDSSGKIKLFDFGVAKISGVTSLTRKNAAIGTLHYMSPEQLQNDAVDASSDIFAFGAVLYEMLTGQQAFPGHYEAAVLYAIYNTQPEPVTHIRPEVSPALQQIIERCLQKQKQDRYPSMAAVIGDLKKVIRRFKSTGAKTQKVSKPQPPKQSEQRPCTVLTLTFENDNDGSYAKILREKLDPLITKFEGYLYEQRRSPFILLFGVPKAAEQGISLAMNCARSVLQMAQELKKSPEIDADPQLRCGIESGTVVVHPKKQDGNFTINGEPLDLSLALSHSARPASILCGPQAGKASQLWFDLLPVKNISLGGSVKKTMVFRLGGKSSAEHYSGLHSDRRITSVMVGRNKEMDRLELHLLQLLNGTGKIIHITGDAGVGKSRLVKELKSRESLRRCTLFEGRALSIGHSLSFYPIIQMLKSWAAIAESDDSHTAVQKLETAIAQLSGEKSNEIFPFIATLMGLPLSGVSAARMQGISGQSLDKLILKNLRELLEMAAITRPLVIFIEDLHWCDTSSIEFLESLFRLSAEHPVLFINTLRPDYPQTSERITTTLQNRFADLYEEIRLEPLSADNCRELISNLMKSSRLPKHIQQSIVQRADGNPFFIEEVLRSFVDQDLIDVRSGEIHFSDGIDQAVIPETIQDVLMARIDRFDEETRSLLKLASVIGRYFFYKILREVSGEIESVDERLDDLQEAQVIRRRQRLNEIEYLFKHVLTQEVTYESILFDQRKKLHADVARAIEIVFAGRLNEFYGVLAFHYSRAENMDKAEHFLIKAGEEALRSAASSEALNHFQNALNLYLQNFSDQADPKKIAGLEMNIAMAFYNKGRMAEAVTYFDRGQASLGDPMPQNPALLQLRMLRDLLFFLLELYMPVKRPKKTPDATDNKIINLYHYRADALVSIDSKRLVFNAMDVLQRITRFRLNEIDHGIFIFTGACGLFAYSGISFAVARKVLKYVKPFRNDSDILTEVRHRFHELLLRRLSGDWPEKIVLDEALVKKCLDLGEIWQTGGYLLETGFLLVHRGEFEQAGYIVEKLHEIAETFENSYPQARSYHLHALLLIKQGLFVEAGKIIDEGLEYLKELNEPLYVIILWAFRLVVRVQLKQMDEAAAAFEQVNELLGAEDAVFPYFRHYAEFARLLYLTDLAGSAGPQIDAGLRKQALRAARKSIKTDRQIAEGSAESLRVAGSLHWHLGDSKNAGRFWQQSLDTARKLGMKPDIALTALEILNRVTENADKAIAPANFDTDKLRKEADEIFTELKMLRFADELQNGRGMVIPVNRS